MEENTTIQASAPVAQSFAVPFAIVIAGLAIAGAIYFGDNKKGALPVVAAGGVQGAVALDPVTSADHILGNPDAKIIIVEYSDTECPWCKTFHPTMQRIMNEYGNDGQVAWVYRHSIVVPQHTKAFKEAEATECAAKLGGNIKFWEYLNNLFDVTPSNNGLDLAELPKIAKTVKLDEKAFNNCLTSGEMSAIVDKSVKNSPREGTPHSIVLVDKKVVTTINGAQPYESVKATIDGLLK